MRNLKTRRTPAQTEFIPRHADARVGRARRGAFTVVVLVCLLVSAMVLGSLLKMAWLHDGQLRRVQMRLQANWLAESGLDRAAARLAVDPAYTGETWTIDALRLGGPDKAAVVIRVEQDESQSQRRKVVAEAAYPAEARQQARLTRHMTITLAQEK
jgi:hypothetical protein